MRVGDFSVEVIGADSGSTQELGSGHVLARPGQVYKLRLRNHGPLRAVADISIDGHNVSGGGLVINAWGTVDLERPIHASERGRFTVIAEGNERVFGPDGGRDNPDLGLIEAKFRRELPQLDARELPSFPHPTVKLPTPPSPAPEPDFPWRSPSPEWTPPTWKRTNAQLPEPLGRRTQPGFNALLAATSLPLEAPTQAPASPPSVGDSIERAAGTGLTGTSNQEFVPVHVGTLEQEATVITLRIVIGTEEAMAEARAIPQDDAKPQRPVARP